MHARRLGYEEINTALQVLQSDLVSMHELTLNNLLQVGDMYSVGHVGWNGWGWEGKGERSEVRVSRVTHTFGIY